MDNIVKFPTNSVKAWNSIEKTLRGILNESEASQEMTEVVLQRMHESYKEHEMDYQMKFNLPPEQAVHVEEEINTFVKALQERTNKLLLSRLLLEIKLARAQGY